MYVQTKPCFIEGAVEKPATLKNFEKDMPLSIYIKLKVCLSLYLSAIEIKLETFRYTQTYESYITFSREAKYGILISIRIVYGGLRAYIYSTYIKILGCRISSFAFCY